MTDNVDAIFLLELLDQLEDARRHRVDNDFAFLAGSSLYGLPVLLCRGLGADLRPLEPLGLGFRPGFTSLGEDQGRP